MSVSSFVININKNLIKYGNIMNFKYGFVIHAWVTLRKLKGFDWLTYSMEQSPPWQANSSSASQEISYLSWNSKVQYHVHKSHWSLSWARWMQSIPQRHVFFNLPCVFFPLNFTTNIFFLRLSAHTYYMPHPSHPSWSECPCHIWCRIQIMKLFIMYTLPASHYFLPPT